MEQTTIPVPEVSAMQKTCAWCDQPATKELVLEPSRYGTAANGARVLRRHPLTAPVCARHAESLERKP